MKKIRQFLKDMTPEDAEHILGHKTKHQVAKWLAHGQIPFTAADKILETMFYQEIETPTPEQEVDPAVMQEQAEPEPEPQYTPEELRVMRLEEELQRARVAMATGSPQPQPVKTWADVAALGARKPVPVKPLPQQAGVEKTREISPGVLEVDPGEQSTRSMVLPGRTMVVPPRPQQVASGPTVVVPQQPMQKPRPQLPSQPSKLKSPRQVPGWIKAPTQEERTKSWTTPGPKPPPTNPDGSARPQNR